MKWLTTTLKFLTTAVANLIADVAQVEAAVPSITGILGATAAVVPASGTPGRIAGSVVASASAFALALPKIAAAGQTAESELQQLLKQVQGAPASAFTPAALLSDFEGLAPQIEKLIAAAPGDAAKVVAYIESTLAGIKTQIPVAPAPAPMHPPVVPPPPAAS